MLTNRIYKLETAVGQYKSDDITNIKEQILNICQKSGIKHLLLEEYNYIWGAIVIPYSEAILLTDSYNNQKQIYSISQEYNLPEYTTMKRMCGARRLNKSLIYKDKIAELYNIKTHKKIKSKTSKV